MSKIRHYAATFFTEPTCIPDCVRYMIVGTETCPTTGKKHWQSYMELHKACRMAAIKKAFDDNTIHLEARKGTRDQAREYCMKDGEYVEYGKWIKGQGHRTDLDEAAAAILNGTKKLTDLIVEDPWFYCGYRNGLKDIQQLADKRLSKEFRHVNVEIVSGPTGCGKTRYAMEHDDVYKIEGTRLSANNNMGWFDGYEGEKTLVIDEYDNNVPITRLLTLLDGYQLQVPVKGGATYARWTKVIITTNLKPHELHPQAKPAHLEALNRRVTTFRTMWDDEVQG